MTARVLIVDDDPVQRRLLDNMVRKFGHEPVIAESGDQAAALLTGGERFDCVVLDLVMPDLDGLGVLARMREAGSNVPVIVQTAHGGIDNVVSAMRAGAVDFVVKPVGAERLQVSLRNALEKSALEDELAPHQAQPVRHADVQGHRHPQPEDAGACCAAPRRPRRPHIPVLIEGESGVGKELIARAIHGQGERRAKPFVAVNCGAIPDNLVESILFGHEKGAFTGATEKHTGKFVEASGGTLFLDEVGELPMAAQVKLLRAIQEGEVEPVGGAQARQGRRADHLRHQPQPDRRRQKRPLPRGPVLPPARVPDRGAAAARARRGHPRSGAAFPRPDRGRGRQARPRASAARRWRCSAATAGPATCASSRTRCSAPWCWPKATASASTNSRRSPRRSRASRAARPPGFAEPMRAGDDRGAAAARYRRRASRPLAPSTHGALGLLDAHGDVRPLEEIEAEAIRFAIAHYRGQMSEVARRLQIGRSTLYRKLENLGLARALDRGAQGTRRGALTLRANHDRATRAARH